MAEGGRVHERGEGGERRSSLSMAMFREDSGPSIDEFLSNGEIFLCRYCMRHVSLCSRAPCVCIPPLDTCSLLMHLKDTECGTRRLDIGSRY